MNIKGVFLHVMADALGSVVVLISASVIWLTDWEYRDYLDPVLSLVIVFLISMSTWPLLRDSIMILLNSAPPHVDTDKVILTSHWLTQIILTSDWLTSSAPVSSRVSPPSRMFTTSMSGNWSESMILSLLSRINSTLI